MKEYNIASIPGDGIGKEVVPEGLKVLKDAAEKHQFKINFTEYDFASCDYYEKHGKMLPDDWKEKIGSHDAIFFGAVGDPSKVPDHISLWGSLLKFRREFDQYVNLRPVKLFNGVPCPLANKKPGDIDILIVRELTGGIYFGEPRGVKPIENGERRGVNTHVYTTKEIKRIAKVGFETAKARSKKLCSVDKANVLESTELWREVVTEVSKDYPDVELSHMYVDNASMQLVRNPKQFDVILADNLFGDILSDEAAMLTGSLGMLPSASLGAVDSNNFRKSLYEPVHGSAPDIAGKGIANPIASILSFAMCLKYSFNMDKESDLINKAVNNVLASGFKTADLIGDDNKNLSTVEMGDQILNQLKENF